MRYRKQKEIQDIGKHHHNSQFQSLHLFFPALLELFLSFSRLCRAVTFFSFPKVCHETHRTWTRCFHSPPLSRISTETRAGKSDACRTAWRFSAISCELHARILHQSPQELETVRWLQEDNDAFSPRLHRFGCTLSKINIFKGGISQ